MKSYLDLVPISARVHRKQTRMTRLCILLSVFLIASLFSMADMFLRSQKAQAVQNDGAWHVLFRGLTPEQEAVLDIRPEIQTGGRYLYCNINLDQDLFLEGYPVAVAGMEPAVLELHPYLQILEGRFPEAADEILLSENAVKDLGREIGDTVQITVSGTARAFRICGILENTSAMERRGAFAALFTLEAYSETFGAVPGGNHEYYVQFVQHCRIDDALTDICQQLQIDRADVAENTKLLALMLQSGDVYVQKLYQVAGFLAVLVAVSGILMMSGSLSTTVARRTEFFGLLRCLGATPAQVRRFVVQEALSWCLTAVPAGLAASAVTVWALCALLRGLTPTWFAAIPVFGISVPGLLAGAVIGILTVLIAARTPSRRAARVSPLAAVSGGAGTVFEARGAADTRLFPVETALGIHHAVGDRKNLLLLTGSFAISIVLFLSFSLGISFLHHALRAMQPWTPDVSVVSSSLTCEIPDTLREQLSSHPAVKRIFGRGFAYDIPAVLGGQSGRVTLLSYEEHQFGWAEKQLRAGSMDEARSGTGVLVYGAEDLDLNPGDILSLETSRGSREVPVAGILSYLPFDRGDNLALIVASEDLFESLTGESGSTILDLQLSDQSDEAVQELRDITGDAYTFSDSRASNTEIRAVYLSAALFVYGFLAVITLIAALSEINSIRMSVHARIRQYGAMRAVGMELRQLRVMVSAETLTGLLLGLTVGLAAGFPLHWLLHMKLITARWGDPWAFPLMEFSVIGLVMLLSAILAITGPVREIGRQSVVDTIRSA